MSLDELFDDVRAEEDLALEDGSRHRAVRERLLFPDTTPKVPAARGFTLAWLAAPGLAVAAVVLGYVFWPSPAEPGAITYARAGAPAQVDDFLGAASETPLPLTFSDGSEVALTPHSGARVQALRANGAHVRIEQGEAEVDVVHREDTSWAFDAGPYVVRVVGTRFRVAWDPRSQELAVRMYEGHVVIEGPEGTRDLHGGEQIRMTPGATRPDLRVVGDVEEIVPAHERAAVAPALQDPPPPVASRGMRRGPPPPPSAVADRPVATLDPDMGPAESREPGPRAHRPPPGARPTAMRRRRPRGHAPMMRVPPSTRMRVSDVEATPGMESARAEARRAFQATLRSASERELRDLAAQLRFERDPREGQVRGVIQERFPGSAAASESLFLSARSAQRAGRTEQAERLFRQYLSEAPRGSYAAVARGRLLEIVARDAGRGSEARSLARGYLRRHPRGGHARLAQDVLARER